MKNSSTLVTWGLLLLALWKMLEDSKTKTCPSTLPVLSTQQSPAWIQQLKANGTTFRR